ncbi:phospholipase A2 inhibitor NAI-like isoform X2 [Hyperolius riggenbachi]|uniref:phospholipase A2 inhibitor NAI-like isoform X2 n=1 Tax=Hyperolius riggenbachi TaxID=752182 RepID=UPI0035A32616
MGTMKAFFILCSYILLGVDGTEYQAFSKKCAVKQLCGVCVKASTIEEPNILRIGYQCSSDDGSSLEYKRMCTEEEPENGLKCPNCYNGTNSDACKSKKSKEYVKCRGNQLECFHYGGDLLFPNNDFRSISAKGCITKGACKTAFLYIPGATEMKRNVFKCTPAETV